MARTGNSGWTIEVRFQCCGAADIAVQDHLHAPDSVEVLLRTGRYISELTTARSIRKTSDPARKGEPAFGAQINIPPYWATLAVSRGFGEPLIIPELGSYT